MSTERCTAVSAACPVEATTYGYTPSLPPNIILLVVFAIVVCAQTVLGSLTKVYAFSIVVAIGALMETVGYGGRLMMHDNPWSQPGMRMQIVCLIIGPSFTAAGIYLTMKHAIIHYGAEASRLKPKLYTWIFIGCDIGSILLQAAGGGLAGAADDDMDLLNTGNNIIIAGIAFQVATMVACGILTIDYTIRQVRRSRHAQQGVDFVATPGSRKAKLFLFAVGFAYLTVLIRCIYRLPEMAGGWGNPRMRNEKEFLILDGLMIALAAVTLTIFHPGYFFPMMRSDRQAKQDHSESLSSQNVELENRGD
ncbi:Efflux pump himE [Paramyrothecium foliicola]|nr:Efflux pump himE [Paramyrothecium foliicola]